MVEVAIMKDHGGDGRGQSAATACCHTGEHTVQCDGDFGYNLIQLLAVTGS